MNKQLVYFRWRPTTVEKETFGTAKMAEEAPHTLLGIMKRESTAS
jgi:hypothetical protein